MNSLTAYQSECRALVARFKRRGLIRFINSNDDHRAAADKCRELGLLMNETKQPKIDKRKKEWRYEHRDRAIPMVSDFEGLRGGARMKCPLCNKLLAKTKEPHFLVCKTPGCYRQFTCDVDYSWVKLRNQIKALRAQAVKQAYKQRRCRTCDGWTKSECDLVMRGRVGLSFGCIHWKKKGAK